jgi:hypothetical protein
VVGENDQVLASGGCGGDRGDLDHSEIATLLSVARNDNVKALIAFVLESDNRLRRSTCGRTQRQ